MHLVASIHYIHLHFVASRLYYFHKHRGLGLRLLFRYVYDMIRTIYRQANKDIGVCFQCEQIYSGFIKL